MVSVHDLACIYFSIMKGIKASARMLTLVGPLTFSLLLIWLGLGIIRPGSGDGLLYLITKVDWEKFTQISVSTVRWGNLNRLGIIEDCPFLRLC